MWWNLIDLFLSTLIIQWLNGFISFTVERDYGRAMKHYLEIGCVSTSYFSRPVPPSTFDDKVCISATLLHIFL